MNNAPYKLTKAKAESAGLGFFLKKTRLNKLVVATATENNDNSENDNPCAVIVEDVA